MKTAKKTSTAVIAPTASKKIEKKTKKISSAVAVNTCARCSETFSDNLPSSCKVSHEHEFEVEGGEMIEPGYSRAYVLEYQCCKKKYVSDSFEDVSYGWKNGVHSNLDDVDYCFIGLHEPDTAKAKEAERSQVTTNNKKATKDMKSFVAMITKAEKDRRKRIREDRDDEDDEDRSNSEDDFFERW